MLTEYEKQTPIVLGGIQTCSECAAEVAVMIERLTERRMFIFHYNPYPVTCHGVPEQKGEIK